MKTKIRNSIRRLLLIPLVFVCFALSPRAQAVVPAPDGGYPGQNTAEGTQALFSLTTGIFNTADGFHALFSNTTGIINTATGNQALHPIHSASSTQPLVIKHSNPIHSAPSTQP